MSGRSAHVRKKITETKKGELKAPGDGYAVNELPVLPYGQQGQHTADFGDHRPGYAPTNRNSDASGSLGRESPDEKRIGGEVIRPLDDFAYARARKPTIKAEDMTGITKSGVRSAYDKKSEDFRKGISKAFGFGGKKGKGTEGNGHGTEASRRPHTGRGGPYNGEQGRVGSAGQIYELPGDTAAGPPTIPPPSAQLPPLPNELQVRRWIGTGRPVQRWNKLRKDPELWDPNGDVLIYLCSKEQNHSLDPSLRLSSHIIEATDSRYLVTLLREGVTEDDTSMPSSPGTPALSAVGISPLDHSASADGGISYELYFPPPPNASKLEQLRYQLTTRNVFAILCHVSLVGLSLYQALSDLLTRLEEYVPQKHVDNVLTIMSYLSARGIDDVRNDAETAIGLLAWSEDPKVRWEEAWREAFVHAAGLYGISRGRLLMESSPDFKKISPITRALLERASLETQLRVQGAEERLASFSFADMWPMSISIVASVSGALVTSPAKDAADRLQRFLLEYYRSAFGGRWPPPPPSNEALQQSSTSADEPIWLTRTVAQALQKDFGALYDYLVNRDIIWDMSEARPSRKWLMVSESGNKAFEADSTVLPMTDILIEFDNRQRFPHVPHPYPLVPESIPAQATSPGSASSVGSPVSPNTNSSFRKRRGTRTEQELPSLPRAAAIERRVQLAYTESTNIYVLGSDFIQSDLIDAFVRFEKTDRIGDVDPSLARRARWVLLYGILQTLASVSVDAPNVRYREGVPYHLSPQLKGARLPPWAKKPKNAPGTGAAAMSTAYGEAAHELSHCWVVPRQWTTASNTSASDNDEDDEQNDHAGPPLLDDTDRMGFPYPPPLALSASRTTGSSDAGSTAATTPAWLHSASSQSTTRATTPATSANPLSPVFSQQHFSHHQYHALSRKPSQVGPSSGQQQQQQRARVVSSGDGEWSPVRRAEMGFERTRRDMSSSEAGSSTASGQQGRRRRRKDVGEQRGRGQEDYSPASPRERGAGWDDFEEFGEAAKARREGGERPLLSGSPISEAGGLGVVAPVIRDFDALGVDDIMP
ncbi:unnamed protein product [Discula destructiva]